MIADQATTHQFPFGLSETIQQSVVASAKDKASATGSRVNKDAESLLRLGLPINSKEVRRKEEFVMASFLLDPTYVLDLYPSRSKKTL